MSIRLISTDFDGTLVGHPSDGRCVPELAAALQTAKDLGVLWAINTGRSVEHTLEGLEELRAPVQPDFLLTHERELYHFDGGRWVAFGEWNEVCRARHAALFHETGEILEQVRSIVATMPDVRMINEDGHLAGLIGFDEEAMDRVTEKLAALSQTYPDFSWQRNTIYLRFCHRAYNKGTVLGELSRLTKIGPAEILAAGDHFNDLSMLDGRFAKHPACPGNAIKEVKETVARAGGFVSQHPCGKGVAEAISRGISAGNKTGGHAFARPPVGNANLA